MCGLAIAFSVILLVMAHIYFNTVTSVMCLVRRIITWSVHMYEKLDLDLVILYDDDVFLKYEP